MALSFRQTLADQSLWTTAAVVFFGTILLLVLKGWWDDRKRSASTDELDKVGEVTLEELRKYNGRDPFLPILLSVRGVVYDVTKGKDFYGPGGGYASFSGREVARALGLMSMKPEDFTADIDDFNEKQNTILQDWETKFRAKYPIAGKIVPSKELTLAELKKFDGSDVSRPIFLAIKGVIFDVSTGRQFYGPDGIYPFAGHECARAFALLSTDTADCNDNLEGLHTMELEALKDWEDKFYSKYKIVGSVSS